MSAWLGFGIGAWLGLALGVLVGAWWAQRGRAIERNGGGA